VTVRPVVPGLAALLAVVGLAAAVAALAHQDDASVQGATTASTPPAPACVPPPAGDHRITVADDHPPVLLHVPAGSAAKRRTLVLVLPGAGMTGDDMARYTGYDRLADRRNFLVAYPTAAGSRPFWNVSGQMPGKPDDVAYLRKVIKTLTGSAACADPGHVGVTGVSNGGGMSARMACDAADLLAAAAPVAGGYSTLPDCHPRRPLAILEIHGLRDEVVPYSGKSPDHAGAVGPFLDAWRKRDRCHGRADRRKPAANVQELWWHCADGRSVAHERVVDAEHGWPGEDSLRPFSSTMTTWRFLDGFTNELYEDARGK
jgi:polyhydroxybutyrate depolymerase